MINILKQYVWETDEQQLYELLKDGYVEVYRDVNLSSIYEELIEGMENDDMEEAFEYYFGYYGLNELLLVDGMHYWLTLE